MTDFVYLTLKIGDNVPDSAKHIGIAEGMIVDYIDPDEWGLPDFNFGAQHKKAYAIVKVNKSLLPLIKEALKVIAPVETANTYDPRPDTLYRRRRKYIDVPDFATRFGISDLLDRWRGGDSIEPLDARALDISALLKNASEIDFESIIPDINTVSSGSYSVGSGAQDYATLAACAADTAASLTGDLTFELETAVTDTATSDFSTNLGGYVLRLTSDTHHGGLPSAGHLYSINHNSNQMRCFSGNNGDFQIDKLNVKRISDPNNGWITAIQNTDTNVRLTLLDLLLDGNGCQTAGTVITNRLTVSTLRNIIGWDHRLSFPVYAKSCKIQNYISYGNSTGIYCNSSCTCENVASFDNTSEDFLSHSSSTGNNNASSDGTAANGNWVAGERNLINQVAADTFISTDDTSSDFMKLKSSARSAYHGKLPAISNDITETAYAEPYPIGCKQADFLAVRRLVNSSLIQ